MLTVIEKIIVNVLVALYQPFGFSILIAVLFMFFYLFAKDLGLKPAWLKWWNSFKKDKNFRITFLLAFYTSLVLYRTLLNRNMWTNPIADIWGPWGFFKPNGEFTTEAFENTILFIPLIILIFCAFKDKLLKDKITIKKTLKVSLIISFSFSMIIEFVQLLLRLGEFQISDLFHNTLGGLIGGIIYYAGYKIIEKKKSDKR